MMKKIILATAILTLACATPVMADGNKKVETGDIAFEIPAEIAEQVTVKTDDLDKYTLVDVYETASLDAAKALGRDENTGAGWLFGIAKMPESEVIELRCASMDGAEVFAEDDDWYLVYMHPTDVRFVREDMDNADEEMEKWSAINTWAGENVQKEILANNSEYEPEQYTNTSIDVALSRAEFGKDTNYVLRSLEYQSDLNPSVLDNDDFIEDLAENFVYKYADTDEAPDGEYLVLAFDDVRFDFFPGEENYIREVRDIDGEEYTTLYVAEAKEADEDYTPYEIVHEWCDAIANATK